MKHVNKNRLFIRVLTLVMAAALLMGTMTFALADENDARKGVMCIEYGYVKDNGEIDETGWTSVGSAFLINSNTLLTCYHVVHFTEDDEEEVEIRRQMETKYGADWERHMGIQVIVANGTKITAIEDVKNAEVDFSVLTLQRPITDRSILPLRKKAVDTSEQIYALGFPYSVTQITEGTAYKYTYEDVTVTSGTVSKAQTMVNGMNYIQHNAIIQEASSGGPLVDSNGAVVGINAGVDKATQSYRYATAIDQVIITLDSLNIEYTPAEETSTVITPPVTDDPPATTTENPTDVSVAVDKTELNRIINQNPEQSESKYTSDSWKAYTDAKTRAENVRSDINASQSEVNAALDALNRAYSDLALKPDKLYLIIGIAAAAVVAAIIIVLIVLRSSKNKRMNVADTPVYNQVGGFEQNRPQHVVYQGQGGSAASETDVIGGQTTVLNNGATETTVLNTPPYAVLTTQNGERIQVSGARFVIGRERQKVDYCITGNNAVGRTHATITNENGIISVVDMHSTNFTFVNGRKCRPDEAVQLKSGDTLTLANMDFKFELL